ncbi:MAG TPA: FGGY family carbohydrate kinase [Tepidisphaeraceae bacterium]|jgi:xylulokinase
MRTLALDFGSTSLKAATLDGTKVVGQVARAKYTTRYSRDRAEVDPGEIFRVLEAVVKDLGSRARKVEAIALGVMSPAWLAMDKRGRAITPIVTHQDRRSVRVAVELERRLGKARYLKLAGNRPAPGGISCTTWAWFLENEAAVMKRADLCGHLNTLLHRVMTGARVIDPSNASFTGLYATVTQKGWHDDLIESVGIKRNQLPQVIGANQVAGFVTQSAARTFGLVQGTPMLAGCVDGSAAMMLTGAKVGQLTNVSGSTDVLALCVEKPVPHERLITRALGMGNKWLSVATLAAAGAAFDWTRRVLFSEMSERAFWKVVEREGSGSRVQGSGEAGVVFEPYLAGERSAIEQRRAVLRGLGLGTAREDMLKAIVRGLARASAERLELLSSVGTQMRKDVVVSGGVLEVGRLMQRDWPGGFRFRTEENATLRGLGCLVPPDR